jgi:heat shock protein HslJ
MTHLEGPTWHLVRGVAIPDGTTISARFVGGTVSGHAGINRYRADYRLDADVLELGPAATTLMAGDPAAMQAEHDFLQLLGSVDGYRLEDDSLVLMDRGRADILWFAPAPDVAADLTGRWDVRFVRRDDALVSPTAGSTPYLEFSADGSVAGAAGVNRLAGPTRADGDRLHIGPLRTTRMAGSPEAMDEEAAFLEALEAVESYRFDDGQLVLIDGDGETRVTLARPGA